MKKLIFGLMLAIASSAQAEYCYETYVGVGETADGGEVKCHFYACAHSYLDSFFHTDREGAYCADGSGFSYDYATGEVKSWGDSARQN